MTEYHQWMWKTVGTLTTEQLQDIFGTPASSSDTAEVCLVSDLLSDAPGPYESEADDWLLDQWLANYQEGG